MSNQESSSQSQLIQLCLKVGKKYGGRIENWKESLVWASSNEYWVLGNLYDDPMERWEEGYYIHTSKIVHLDYENKTLETLNTIYTLGKPYVSENN